MALPGGRLAVIHADTIGPAARRHWRLREAYRNVRAVVYGHSHRLVIDDSAAPWILNPGAAGKTRTYGGPSYLILHAAAAGWKIEVRQFAKG